MSTLSKARLYGGGTPATGVDAELSLFGQEIHVRTSAGVFKAPITALRIREVGTENPPGLELAWDSSEGTRAVQILDRAAVRALREHPVFAATAQMQALRSQQRRSRVGRSIGWTLVALVVLLPVLLLLIFVWQADRIAAAAADRISIEHEVKLGEQIFASMRGTLALQNSGPAYEAVQTIGQRLTRGSKYSYRFHLAQNDVLNAFAIPGGIVVVHTGLIQATRRPEELAGVLAHEVQHVEQRHSLRAVVKDLGLRGLWLLVAGDASVLSSAALELTSLKFSRDAETEADRKGFAVLIANGIDPSGMADFFAIMQKKASVEPPPFLSTHPGSADREATLRALTARVKEQKFAPLQLGSWPPQVK